MDGQSQGNQCLGNNFYQDYHFRIEHRADQKNGNADGLSRMFHSGSGQVANSLPQSPTLPFLSAYALHRTRTTLEGEVVSGAVHASVSIAPDNPNHPRLENEEPQTITITAVR